MKKLKVAITKGHLVATLEAIELIRLDKSQKELHRAAGFLEGILYTVGDIAPKSEFAYKEIEYVEIGWLGGKTIKTRTQSYLEFMIERTQRLINSLE